MKKQTKRIFLSTKKQMEGH